MSYVLILFFVFGQAPGVSVTHIRFTTEQKCENALAKAISKNQEWSGTDKPAVYGICTEE